jgi:hypothetical protein
MPLSATMSLVTLAKSGNGESDFFSPAPAAPAIFIIIS